MRTMRIHQMERAKPGSPRVLHPIWVKQHVEEARTEPVSNYCVDQTHGSACPFSPIFG